MIKVEEALKRFQYNDILDVATAALPWGELSGKAVTVYDASSLVGFYIVCALLVRNDVYGDGIKVTAVVRDNMRCSGRFGDLLIRDDITVAVSDLSGGLKTNSAADFVIYLPEAPRAGADAAAMLESSVEATDAILKYAEKCKVKSVLAAMGTEVYGELMSGEDYISETQSGYLDRLDTKNLFAFGERAGEALCGLYARNKGVPVKMARMCSVYGPSLESDSVWSKILSCAVRGDMITINDSDSAVVSLCYVSDAAEALLTVLLCGSDAYPYNVSSEYSNVSMREFAKAAQGITSDRGTRLEFAEPSDERERQRSYFDRTPNVLDNKRLKDLGWVGRTTVKEGIRKSVRILSD